METLIELTIVFVLGWYLGSKVTMTMQILAFRAVLKELGVTEQQLRKLGHKIGIDHQDGTSESKDDLEEIHIKLESHSGVIYAFRKDNDQFLGQGSNREQLIDHLKSRLTNVRLIVDEGADLIKQPE